MPAESFAALPHVNVTPESIRVVRVVSAVPIAVSLGGITVYLTTADAHALHESLSAVLDTENDAE